MANGFAKEARHISQKGASQFCMQGCAGGEAGAIHALT